MYFPDIENEKYNVKKKVIISSSGGGSGGGILSWDDVVEKPSLLCCEEKGPIPGRTLLDGEGLDWRFKPADDYTGDELTFISAEEYKALLKERRYK